jgi:hypothetical protein
VNPQKGLVTIILFQLLNKHSEVTLYSVFLLFLLLKKARTICAQVFEEEDEVENNLFLGF